MQILMMATGKCRDKHILELENEYLRRLPPIWRVQVRELPEKGSRVGDAPLQLAALEELGQQSVFVVLDERGDNVDSVALAKKFEGWQGRGLKHLVLMIGGADGFADEVRKRADWVWSLSALTLPHQLVRVVLAEQLYRVHTLISGHPYHRV